MSHWVRHFAFTRWPGLRFSPLGFLGRPARDISWLNNADFSLNSSGAYTVRKLSVLIVSFASMFDKLNTADFTKGEDRPLEAHGFERVHSLVGSSCWLQGQERAGPRCPDRHSETQDQVGVFLWLVLGDLD